MIPSLVIANLLAKGHSREALAVWTPIGLIQPTTLPFEQKNNDTETQGSYRAAAAELRNGRRGNYVDDWIGWADTEEQLCDDFANFLRVCDKSGINLGTAKQSNSLVSGSTLKDRISRPSILTLFGRWFTHGHPGAASSPWLVRGIT